MQIEATTAPAEVVAQALAISRAAGLDVCGIEFLVDQRDGRPYFYDVNALSNFVTDATRVVGFDPFERLVEHRGERRRVASPRTLSPWTGADREVESVFGPCAMTLPVAGAVDQSRPRTLLDLVGNTPLLRLRRFERADGRVRLYAKAEWRNPGGSVKDRAAAAMILDGERQGLLTPARPSSTPLGQHRHRLRDDGRRARLRGEAVHAEQRHARAQAHPSCVRRRTRAHRSDGGLRRRHPQVRQLYAEDPAPDHYPDQYSNPVNWRAHYDTTGPELLAQTEGAITHFVAGLGTSGTFMGIGRYFRDHAPHVRLISVQPETALHGLEGLKHMESAIVPPIYDPALADEDERAGTEDAFTLTRRLATEEGLLVGISSGAALSVGLRVASRLDAGVVVMIFCDGGEKYLSERFWEEPPEGSFVGGVN